MGLFRRVIAPIAAIAPDVIHARLRPKRIEAAIQRIRHAAKQWGGVILGAERLLCPGGGGKGGQEGWGAATQPDGDTRF